MGGKGERGVKGNGTDERGMGRKSDSGRPSGVLVRETKR